MIFFLLHFWALISCWMLKRNIIVLFFSCKASSSWSSWVSWANGWDFCSPSGRQFVWVALYYPWSSGIRLCRRSVSWPNYSPRWVSHEAALNHFVNCKLVSLINYNSSIIEDRNRITEFWLLERYAYLYSGTLQYLDNVELFMSNSQMGDLKPEQKFVSPFLPIIPRLGVRRGLFEQLWWLSFRLWQPTVPEQLVLSNIRPTLAANWLVSRLLGNVTAVDFPSSKLNM